MYTSFFGLSEKPFSITPDPRYLFLSARHADALAHLLYGITESGGFIQLTGEVGTGKTTLVRSLLEQLPDNAEVALILNPRMSARDFLRTICQELHVELPYSPSDKDLVDALNEHLLAAHAEGRRVVVMVDEAQNLAADVLEQVRLLTNLETSKQKLLQIILVGQPELRALLARVDLRQLAQRVTGRFHLLPLDRRDSASYVRHRMQVAGATGEIFRPGALKELYRLSGGIPRIINVVADRALLGAYTREQGQVSAALIREAAAEVHGRQYSPAWLRWTAVVLALGGTAALALGVNHLMDSRETVDPGQATALSLPDADPVANQLTPVPQDVVVPVATATIQGARPGNDMQQLLQEFAADTGTDTAMRELIALWGGSYDSADERPACQQAQEQGLDCVFQRGSWAQLRLQNRPVILILIDDQGLEHQVVLSALGEGLAELAIGNERVNVPLDGLSRYWFGDYLLMWRPRVPNAGRPLMLGSRGEDVLALRGLLDQLNGYPTAMTASDVFDAELQRLVREFQREQRLQVDGIAGTQTLIALASAVADPAAPELIRP